MQTVANKQFENRSSESIRGLDTAGAPVFRAEGAPMFQAESSSAFSAERPPVFQTRGSWGIIPLPGLIYLLAVAFTCLSQPVFAQNSPVRDVYETTREVVRALTPGEEDLMRDGRFTRKERDAILRGLVGDSDGGKKGKKLPPGLQKKIANGGDLPPGWQKKFARGEVVGYGVYQQRSSLPRNVLDDLRVLSGSEVIWVDDKVARILKDTRTIIDVIDIIEGR